MPLQVWLEIKDNFDLPWNDMTVMNAPTTMPKNKGSVVTDNGSAIRSRRYCNKTQTAPIMIKMPSAKNNKFHTAQKMRTITAQQPMLRSGWFLVASIYDVNFSTSGMPSVLSPIEINGLSMYDANGPSVSPPTDLCRTRVLISGSAS